MPFLCSMFRECFVVITRKEIQLSSKWSAIRIFHCDTNFHISFFYFFSYEVHLTRLQFCNLSRYFRTLKVCLLNIHLVCVLLDLRFHLDDVQYAFTWRIFLENGGMTNFDVSSLLPFVKFHSQFRRSITVPNRR